MSVIRLLSKFLGNYRKQILDSNVSGHLIWRVRSIFYVLVILYTLIVTFFFPQIQTELQPIKLQEFIFNSNFLQVLLLTALVGPLMEELFFRAGMTWGSKNVSFLLGSLIFLLLNFLLSDYILNLGLSQFYKSILSYTLFIFTVIGSFHILKPFFPSISRAYVKRPAWIFWILTSAFALAHMTNFDLQNWNPVLLLLIVPQFLLGIMLGFIRIQWGLSYAILIHMFHNFLQLIPLFILKKLSSGVEIVNSIPQINPEKIVGNPRSIVLTGYGLILSIFIGYHIVKEIQALRKSTI